MTKQNEILNDERYKSVLDFGFVGLVEHMGSDASIAQSARVSYGTGTRKTSEDRALIRYLINHNHSSPLEMADFRFHMKLPIFVARQLVRHRTASLNEYSGRYSEMSDECYVPELDRLQPQSLSNKQGSEGKLSDAEAKMAQYIIKDSSEHAFNDYKQLLSDKSCRGGDDFSCAVGSRQGVSRELARLVLPVNNYTELYWKIDLKNSDTPALIAELKKITYFRANVLVVVKNLPDFNFY